MRNTSDAASDVLRVAAIGIAPEKNDCGLEDLEGRIDDGDAAVLEFGGIARIEEKRPAVGNVRPKPGPELVDVVAETGARPKIRHRVQIARIVDGHAAHDFRVRVLQIRDGALVELAVDARAELAVEVILGRHDDVVIRAAGQKLRLEHFVVVERVVMDLDARLLLEVRDRIGGYVVDPRVDVQDVLGMIA